MALLTPSYEIKLLLNPDITLDPQTHIPIPSILTAFSFSPDPIKMAVQFLDSSSKTLYTAGWSPRIRLLSDKPSELELTYKKRYSILDQDVDTALNAAATDGFTSDDKKWEAQVEWGWAGMGSLSISRGKDVDWDGDEKTMELPDAIKSRGMLIKEAPGKFEDFKGEEEGWGVKMLEEATVYGPVVASRWVGSWEGTKMYLEVWPILIRKEGRVEYVTEVSFKAKKRGEGGKVRERLRGLLEGEGWLREGDSLRTVLIMENY